MSDRNNIINTFHEIIYQITSRSQNMKCIISLSLIATIFLLHVFLELSPLINYSFFSNGILKSINSNSDYYHSMTSNQYLRHLSENETIETNNSTHIVELLSQLSSRLYSGQWHDDETNKKGKIIMKIIQANKSILRQQEYLQVLFRLNENNTIDKWVVVTSTGKMAYMKSSNTSFEGKYFSIFEYGSNLDRPTSEQKCDSLLKLEFAYENTTALEDITETETNKEKNNASQDKIVLFNIIKGEFTSDCNLNFKFTAEIEEMYANFWIITVYSIIVSLLCICSLFNSGWMIYKLDNSVVYGNSISLITISENIIWNAYGCLCHFFLSLSLYSYYIQFGIPSFLFFLNFTIIDIRLLYKLWSLKFSAILHDSMLLRRKLVQFYFVFYVIMFFSFFFVLKFYFDKTYVVIALLLTWIPQIVFNAYYQNKISMPILFIVITGLNRMFPSLYFRGYKHNFFDLSTDWLLIFSSIVIMLVTTLFMYSQTLYGSRWFLPEKYKGNLVDLYKTKEEALKLNPNCDHSECLICLDQLFQTEKTFLFPNDFVSNGENENIQIITPLYKKKVVNDIMTSILDFHERSMNVHHKQFMMTPCNHIFHSNCLESWFKMKKECPSCRAKIDLELCY